MGVEGEARYPAQRACPRPGPLLTGRGWVPCTGAPSGSGWSAGWRSLAFGTGEN